MSTLRFALVALPLFTLAACASHGPDDPVGGPTSGTKIPPGPSGKADADAPIRLLSAEIVPGDCDGCVGLRGRVEVADLAYDKVVSFVYAGQSADSGDWQVASAHWVSAAQDGWEIWELSYTSLDGLADGEGIDLALAYDVDGKTYWDNANGRNYSIERGAVLGNGVNVLLSGSYVSANKLYQNVGGELFLRDLAYEKNVQVLYSTDDWSTSNTTDAVYVSGPDPQGVELWRFMIPDAQKSASFALRYDVDGKTYWDDNFGHDYFQAF
jgi:hypothetical protein